MSRSSWPNVAYETVRFRLQFARNLRTRRPKPSGQWHLDEMVVSIQGWRLYLWRAVDSEGEVPDLLTQEAGLCPSGARHRQAALVCLGQARTRLSARREQGLRANNRAENSHQGATTRAQDARLQVARINAAPPPLPRGRPTTPSHSSATPSPVVRSTLSGRKRHARGKSRLPQQKLTLTPADVRPQMRCRDSAPQNAAAYRALYEHYRILAEDPAIRRVMNRLRGGVALRNHETH
jgi:DDE superfamily endonuclease